MFEVTGFRKLLFIFPNLFENYFIYYLVVKKWFPRFVPKTVRATVITLLILLIPKMFQEWILHYQAYTPWWWFKTNFLNLNVPVLLLTKGLKNVIIVSSTRLSRRSFSV